MANKDIVKRVYEIMIDGKLNQREFAEKIGVTEATVSHWFSGKHKINLSTLQKISKAFRIPLTFLLGEGLSEADKKAYLQQHGNRALYEVLRERYDEKDGLQ